MKKSLLVAATGFAFDYFRAYLENHAWKKYYQVEKDDDADDTVNSALKFHLHRKLDSSHHS